MDQMASEKQTQGDEEKRPLPPPGQLSTEDLNNYIGFDRFPDLDDPAEYIFRTLGCSTSIDGSQNGGLYFGNTEPAGISLQSSFEANGDDLGLYSRLENLSTPSATYSSTVTDYSYIEDTKVSSYELSESNALYDTNTSYDPRGLKITSDDWDPDPLSWSLDTCSKSRPTETDEPSKNAEIATTSPIPAFEKLAALVKAQLYELQSDSKKTPPTNMRTRSNTFSSFTEDETDWGDDDITSAGDLNFPSFSSFAVLAEGDSTSQNDIRDSLTRPILSPMKQALVDRIMKEFWAIFDQETGISLDGGRHIVQKSDDSALDMRYDSNDYLPYVNDPFDESKEYPSQAPRGGYHLDRKHNISITDSGIDLEFSPIPYNNDYAPHPALTGDLCYPVFPRESQAHLNNADQSPDLPEEDFEVSEHLRSSTALDSAVIFPLLRSEGSNDNDTDLLLDCSSVDTDTPRYIPCFTSGRLPNSYTVTAAHEGKPHWSGAIYGANSRTRNSNQENPNSILGKRRRDDEDDSDQNEGGDGSPKRPKKFYSPPQHEDDSRKLACPYRKRDPRKYCIQHWRPCALTPLETIARVKGHLYRHHRIFPCQRCKQLFRNQDEVNSHLRESTACELSDGDYPDGITAEIVEKLRSKKTAQRTEAERWQDIYKLLFPDEMVPSPYFEPVQEDPISSPDSQELADYEAYCRRELPRDFRTALEEIVQNESQPIEESIRNQLTNIIRDCQDRIYSRYRSLVAASATPSRNTRNSQSPATAISSQLTGTSMPTSANTASTVSAGRISPTFLQPPPPQNHLESRLEVSDLPSNFGKPPSSSDPSDSGYSSNGAGSGSLSGQPSVNSSSDDLSWPSSQDQMIPLPVSVDTQDTFNMNDRNENMHPHNDDMNSDHTALFEDSLWEDGPQIADEGTGELNIDDLSMEFFWGRSNIS